MPSRRFGAPHAAFRVRPILRAALLLAAFACLAPAFAHAGIVVQTLGGNRPYGIDGNNVVGATATGKGFLYDGSTFKLIPNSSAATGISSNKIVGNWGVLGFLYDGTNYTTLTYPGAKATLPWGISGNKIVGQYTDASGSKHGFLYDGSTWTSLDAPLGVFGTYAHGIYGNKIVGEYEDANQRTHGFVYDGTTWTTLDASPSASATSAMGIWGDIIVGVADFPSINPLGSSGFLYNDTSFSYPFGHQGGNGYFPAGTTGLYFKGISGNKLIGLYSVFGAGESGFIATIPEPSTLFLALFGGAFLLVYRWRRSRGYPVN